MKRFLCIRLPNWPIQRLVVAQPELRGGLIVLHAHDPRRGQCVVACSRAAYRCGLRPGMPLAEALALGAPGEGEPSTAVAAAKGATPRAVSRGAIARQHNLSNPLVATDLTSGDGPRDWQPPHIVAHEPQADAEALQQLAQWCECFSPCVGFAQLDSSLVLAASSPSWRSDCLYLDVTNLGGYFGGERRLAYLVVEAFSQRGYLVRVAMADTLGAAWACARFALQNATVIDSLPAGMAAGPPGSSFLVVPPGATVRVLESLPIAALRLPPEMQTLLSQLGIFQIAQLASLPRSSLRARFGEVLLKRWDQACGRAEELLLVHHPVPAFQTAWDLEHPTADLTVIHSILGELLARLTRALLPRCEGAIQCVCRLTCAGDSDHCLADVPPQVLTLHVGLYQPTACAEHLQRLLRLRLERSRLLGPVRQITLEVPLTAPLERRQRLLFADTARHAPQNLAQLVDRLSSRLGAANVVQARLCAEAQPELAYCYLPLTGAGHPRTSPARGAAPAPQESPRKPGRPRPPARQQLVRPLHLRSPPLALDVLAVAPGGPPVQLLLGQRVLRVGRCWGPERLETGWWRGRSVRRDYYRLETTSGQWLWVFRQLEDGRWFLHGMFG